MSISVIIPAHDEERVIARCLGALLADATPGEFEIVVACNGCTDATADVARTFDGVKVLETPVAGKTVALNLGDGAATRFPRLYLDADIVLDTASLRLVARALTEGDALAAAPEMEMDYRLASWAVRAYYRVWRQLPYTREGMIGVGSYALSEAGRARFGPFPDVIADDGYVRMLFPAGERVQVAGARARVTAPARLADLVRIKTRSRLGGFELARRFPDLAARERAGKSYGGAGLTVLLRPWLWPHALVYLYVNLLSRRRAAAQLAGLATYRWERDESSRSA